MSLNRIAMKDSTQACPHCGKPFDTVTERGSSPLALHIRHAHTALPGSAVYNQKIKIEKLLGGNR